MPDTTTWVWEKTDPDRSGASGDVAKLFRHEDIPHPGILAIDAPEPAEKLMAREVIQNSWDAARELRRSDPSVPDFEIEFTFHEHYGEAKADLVRTLDLQGLAERVSHLDRDEIGLESGGALDHLTDDEPLRTLVISEHATTGMYGPWEGAKSHLYLALVSVGYTVKEAGAGGSYGYGKAGLISGSSMRTVIAYTCFRERAEEPGVTRRLLGMTYWGQHDLASTNYTGYSRFGATNGPVPIPFVNDDADDVAKQLGFRIRDPERDEDLGTTFLLIDPTVTPDGLLTSVERNWWPALIDDEFVVTVRDVDAEPHHPRPRRHDMLRSFIRAYEIATTPQDNKQDTERKKVIQDVAGDDARYSVAGTLGLVADPDGWSFADEVIGPEEEPIQHLSLVALIRGPKMIVEYWKANSAQPYVRGTFVADPELDDPLRRSEPKGHDRWVSPLADAILRKVRYQVNAFRNDLKPAVPPAEQIQLPLFDEIMKKVMSGPGRGPKPPIHDTRPFTIHLDQQLEAVGSDRVRVTGSATFGLSEHHDEDTADVVLEVVFKFVEDDRAGQKAELELQVPDGFTGSDGKITGTLHRANPVTVVFTSAAYPMDWSGRLVAAGDVSQPEEAQSEERESE